MAQTIANAQHVWDCRWSTLGYRLSRTNERDQPKVRGCARDTPRLAAP